MDLLFVHNNCPGQFRHMIRHFHQEGGHRLFGIGAKTCPGMAELTLARYEVSGSPPAGVHSFAGRFEGESRRAEGVGRALGALRQAHGINPAIIVVHPGWGENLPLREAFPKARITTYCEFYYRTSGSDVGFDPEFAKPLGVLAKTRTVAKNASTLLALAQTDAGLSPTQWQKSQYPALFHDLITVVHEGVDTEVVVPTPAEPVEIAGHLLTPADEIITYVGRNLEPYRGYHIVMRALPKIMRERPNAKVVIVGANGVSYGAAAPDGKSWKDIFLDEVRDQIDLSRVIYAETLPYGLFLRLFRLSRVHMYLTYPFVLSWSMLEAMASECLVVGSATPPVEEVLRHGENGLLVPFFDVEAWADTVVAAAAEPERYRALRKAARQTVVERYDLKTICLPRQIEVVRGAL
jgi:glycosyltransferase involved in cell wall biosynthesis